MGRPLKVISADDLNLTLIKSLPNHSNLTSDDVRKMMGYADCCSIHQSIKRGDFPAAEHTTEHRLSGRVVRRHYWRVLTIKKYLKEKFNVIV